MQGKQGERRVHFGVFEADLDAGELFKNGMKLRLTEQPFQLLAVLLERPGELVSREELRRRLWPRTRTLTSTEVLTRLLANCETPWATLRKRHAMFRRCQREANGS